MVNAVPGVACAPNLVSRIFGTSVMLLSGLLTSASNMDSNVQNVVPAGDDLSTANLVSNNTHIAPDSNSRDIFQVLFGDRFSKVRTNPNPYTDGLRSSRSIGDGQSYLNNALAQLNPQLLPAQMHSSTTTALNDFNRKNRTSFFCMGIKGDTGEFVFLDNNYFLGRTNIPRRIALTYNEVKDTKGKADVLALLERKLGEHNQVMRNQHSIWSVPYRFDFPRNRGACMLVLEQAPLKGMETDLLSSLRAYTGTYGMTVNALGVGGFHSTNMENLLKNEKIDNLPVRSSVTKEAILSNLESSLKKAIDDRKSYFVFHYLLHGSPDGTIWTDNQPITPEEIAEVLTRPHGRGNKPISEQIDIFMWAGSCYSGRQYERMRAYFGERRDLPVRNFRMITEAVYTTSDAGTNPRNASLVSFIPIMSDNSGTTDYYSAIFDEYMTHLQNSGIHVSSQARSYLQKVRFIDLMAGYDSGSGQDLQGFHYSNDPRRNRVFDHQFSQLEPKISENPDSQNLYARLEDLKGVTGQEWNRYIRDLRETQSTVA